MARSSDINQRIILTGADEVRRHLEEIGKSGAQAGNTIRAQLAAATATTTNFARATQQSTTASRSLQFALTNLSFQANDIATGLASGQDAMRIFAQQAGQVFQAFQQGGGFGTVLRAAGSAITSFITPTTAAVAALVALGAEFVAVVSRAADAQAAVKQFDFLLKAVWQSGQITGQQLETADENMHDVGLSSSEAREQFRKFIGEGGLGTQAEKVVRIGANLNKVLGEGSMEKFVSAAAQGGPALEGFARQLGIVVVDSKEAAKTLNDAAAATDKFNKAIRDAGEERGTSLADESRNKARQIADLDLQRKRQSQLTGDPQLDAARQRAQQEEDIETQSKRRIEDINRQHAVRINELLRQRNEDNAAALAAYNQKITEAAQAAADKQSLVVQIGQKVFGAFDQISTPLQKSILALSEEWNKLQDTLAKSEGIQSVIQGLADFAGSINATIKRLDQLSEAINKVPGLPGASADGQTRTLWGGKVGLAEGGLVHGPGSGTSDSILARISNGEFVMPAAVTRAYLPLLEAMRSMGRPIMPQLRLPRGFAAGGLVGAGAGGGGGSSVFLQFPGGASVGPMMADRQVKDALVREARRSGMKSAGRKPSTA